MKLDLQSGEQSLLPALSQHQLWRGREPLLQTEAALTSALSLGLVLQLGELDRTFDLIWFLEQQWCRHHANFSVEISEDAWKEFLVLVTTRLMRIKW